MSLQPLKVIIQAPIAKHTASIIFIHGLGDSGAGWKPLAEQMAPKFPHVKWILPCARMQPVTINFGMSCPSWFDIRTLDKISAESQEDEAGLLQSKGEIDKLIANEIDGGIPSERILLGGFSQGAALTLLTGLTTERKLAGLAVLSGYIPIRTKTKAMKSRHADTLPIFMAHGLEDEVVPFIMGEMSANYLVSDVGLKKVSGDDKIEGLTFNHYGNMGHNVDQEELEDLEAWMKKAIPP